MVGEEEAMCIHEQQSNDYENVADDTAKIEMKMETESPHATTPVGEATGGDEGCHRTSMPKRPASPG